MILLYASRQTLAQQLHVCGVLVAHAAMLNLFLTIFFSLHVNLFSHTTVLLFIRAKPNLDSPLIKQAGPTYKVTTLTFSSPSRSIETTRVGNPGQINPNG